MQIFISWSGEPSKTVANALRLWLPSVIQAVKPWMSASDIEPGTRWNAKIVEELNVSTFGIICLTRTNLASPWILFEAGALAKTVENTFVVPYLVGGLRNSDVEQPLGQFQAKSSDRDGTWSLVSTINNRVETPLAQGQLKDTFDLWWPKLEVILNDLPDASGSLPARPIEDITEEVLELVRGMARVTVREQGGYILERLDDRLMRYASLMQRDEDLRQKWAGAKSEERESLLWGYIAALFPELSVWNIRTLRVMLRQELESSTREDASRIDSSSLTKEEKSPDS